MRKEAAGLTERPTRRRTAGWSGIPSEIISDIRKRLKTRFDVTRFRSVCKNWRSSVPLPKNPNYLTPFFPRQIPNPKYLPFNKQGYDSLDLVPSSVFLVQQVVDSNSGNSPNLISNCCILTVEERRPGKLRLLYPLWKEPMSNVCKSLNLLDFRMSEIGKSYSFRSFSGSISDCKVVVCSDYTGRVVAAKNSATDFTAVVLYSMGDLFGIRLENGVWRNDRIQSVLWFKDVICFRGTFYAVIGGGKLYVVDQLGFKVTEAVVGDFVCESDSLIKLVETSGELLLVVMNEFKVYRLNELQRKWEVVQALGNKIMFLGADCSFLVPTEDLLRHKGNFVVSSSVMNSSKAKPIELTENFWIYVSCLDVGSKKKLKSSYHSITSILWPPSILFSPNSLPSSRESEEIDKVRRSPVGLVGGSPFLQPENLELTLVPPYSSSKKSVLKEIVVKSEDQGQPEVFRCLNLIGHPAVKDRIDSNLLLNHSLVQKHVFEQESPRYAIVQTDSNALSVEAELPEEASSTVKFKGIDVKSVYLPILQKVWMKHGDVIEGSAIRSSDIMASALDALAKMIRILQTNSGKTLTDAQARYLGSTLSDLQLMHLKVDWLVPYVQKALASQRNKQLQADLLELDRLRTLAEEMERDFLAAMVKVKQDIESDRRLVSVSMQVPEAIDLEICLGEGLC